MKPYVNIHDAYGGFGEKQATSKNQLNPLDLVKNQKINSNNEDPQDYNPQNAKLPTDASYSSYPIKIRCPFCNKTGVTRINAELGTAAWVWCVLLTPFVLSGLLCLCIDSCRDKIHYCTRCGQVVGKKFVKFYQTEYKNHITKIKNK